MLNYELIMKIIFKEEKKTCFLLIKKYFFCIIFLPILFQTQLLKLYQIFNILKPKEKLSN